MGFFDNNYLIFQFILALFLTITIETIVIVILSKVFKKYFNILLKDILFSGFITSFATLPYLWFVLSPLFGNGLNFIIIGELFAFIVEIFIYYFVIKDIKFHKCIILSFVANLISFSIGLLIF